ncbi:hypothetical protein CAF53_01645 [Sphingobium sp. LB126]|nr:hypothetical protein CAF53_01645 [Sphingobium sp. LB126]
MSRPASILARPRPRPRRDDPIGSESPSRCEQRLRLRHTRECLALVADMSLSGVRVARELTRLIGLRGKPHTRYDKLAANFLAMVQLASMRLWLRA